MRIKPYDLIPERWFVCGIAEETNGDEYYFAVLRLPSYQFMRSIETDWYEWHQLAWLWHGKRGFKALWLRAPERT